MFKFHLTAYLIAKTFICIVGYLASVMLHQESSVLITVAVLSALFIPVMAWMEAKQ